jgi:hypothetical protein
LFDGICFGHGQTLVDIGLAPDLIECHDRFVLGVN